MGMVSVPKKMEGSRRSVWVEPSEWATSQRIVYSRGGWLSWSSCRSIPAYESRASYPLVASSSQKPRTMTSRMPRATTVRAPTVQLGRDAAPNEYLRAGASGTGRGRG